MTGERTDGVVPWDMAFMRVADVFAKSRSKDPNTQVGAAIASPNHLILSFGYNGTPDHWDDKKFPWKRGRGLDCKYPYVIHAEENAIQHTPGGKDSLQGATLYVTLYPCNECAKIIAQSGICRVVYALKRDTDDNRAADTLFRETGITTQLLEGWQL